MVRARLFGFMLAAISVAAFSATAMAGSVTGIWQRTDGKARVQFAPCGGGYCGSIVWLKDPDGPAHIGEQVFFGMAQTGPNSWTGSAFNPENGKTYDGTMSLSGNRLTTQGCALGGMLCKTVYWTRHG